MGDSQRLHWTLEGPPGNTSGPGRFNTTVPSVLTDPVLQRGRVRSARVQASHFSDPSGHIGVGFLPVLSGKVGRLFLRPRRAVRTQA